MIPLALRSCQDKLKCHRAWYRTKQTKKPQTKQENQKYLFFIFSLSLVKLLKRQEFLLESEPEQVISQPSSRTGRTCLTEVLSNRRLLHHIGHVRKPSAWVRAILPKEALTENFKDFVHINLLRFITPLFLKSPNSAF